MVTIAHKQRLMSYVLLALLAGGALLATASLVGIAAPPRATALVASFDSLDDLTVSDAGDQMERLRAGRLPAPPFTIEARGRPVGPKAEWGLWIEAASATADFIIDNEGYFFTRSGDWRPFIHLHAGLNRLYLHVDENANMTLRLNGEIAWQEKPALNTEAGWGIAVRRGIPLEGFEMSLRAG